MNLSYIVSLKDFNLYDVYKEIENPINIEPKKTKSLLCTDIYKYDVNKGLENPYNKKIEKNFKLPKYLVQLMNPFI